MPFRDRVPVPAIQFQKDRAVGNAERRLENYNAEQSSALIESGDDLLMAELASAPIIEQLKEVLTECGHARRVLLGNKLEFRIQEYVRSNVLASGDCLERLVQNFDVTCSCRDCFYSRVGLIGVGGICHNYPIAMSKEGKPTCQHRFPGFFVSEMGFTHNEPHWARMRSGFAGDRPGIPKRRKQRPRRSTSRERSCLAPCFSRLERRLPSVV